MRLLLTGGSGRLGTELQALLRSDGAPATRASLGGDVPPELELTAPSSSELDVTAADEFNRRAEEHRPDVIVHAAAYTDVRGAEDDQSTCWRVNVVGTRNAAAAAASCGARLVHISTDYVFWGDRGNYAEDDVLGPTRNYYALTKLVAEEAARSAPEHLVIRTSFRPRQWQYPVAFGDLYTSQDYVDVIAPEIAAAVALSEQIPFSTLHIATERKSVLELARRRSPDVREGSRADSAVPLPADVSLDSSRWQELKRSLGVAA